MNHSFNTEIAKEYGLEEAILLENIYFWVRKNKANNQNYQKGYYWTYNSVKAFNELFDYISPSKINRALKNLEENNLIISDCFNENKYDHTKWYTVTEKAESFFQNEKPNYHNEESILQNEKSIDTNCKISITDINTDINTNIKTDNMGQAQKPKRTTFQKPTIEEIREYCQERKNNVDPQRFFDFYESKGWLVGKSKMKDWKASVRTWEKNSFNTQAKQDQFNTFNNPDKLFF